jgi:hypothetical protein
VDTEIGAAQDVNLVRELPGVAVVDHPPLLEQVGPVGDLEHGRGLLDEEERGPLLAVEPDDHLEQALDQLGREPERKLVDQDRSRPGQQRPADDEHLLLATGKFAGRLATALGEAWEVLEDRAEDVVGGSPAKTAGEPAEEQVLLHGHRREHRPTLGYEGQPGGHGVPRPGR